VLVFVFGVEALALAVTLVTATRTPLTAADWRVFGLLAAGAVVHLEAVRGIERLREGLRGSAPYVDLKSVWTFAGVLLLPPVLAVLLVVWTFVHLRRVARMPAYRWAFSGSTVVLATHAAAAVLQAGVPASHYPGLPQGVAGVLVIVLAGLLRWLVNHGLVVTVIMLSSPTTPARAALGSWSHNLVEAAAVTLGAGVALAIWYQPWFVILFVPPLLVLHRSLLLHQFEVAARTDDKTGLVNSVYWHDVARRELERARRDETSLAVVILDLDHFKRVNDTYGHLAGDAVLKAVAAALQDAVRTDDLVGRWGGEEFAILLPGLGKDDLWPACERLRRAIADVTVAATETHPTIRGLTASVGAVTTSGQDGDLDQLVLAADTALYRAKNGGRNRTVVAPPADGSAFSPIDDEDTASAIDALTGLLHDSAWRRRAEMALARAAQRTLSVGVLLVDLDRFDAVNDQHGRAVGDQVLRRVAETLRSCAGQAGLVGRKDGEEFLMLLPGVNAEQLAGHANQICRLLRQLDVQVGDLSAGPVTASVGGALYPVMADNLEDLLVVADNALFAAKTAGRNQALIVQPTKP
jgi:diguanylate cyclase (GGDEF)-like protein